jgi:hypothetical protein
LIASLGINSLDIVIPAQDPTSQGGPIVRGQISTLPIDLTSSHAAALVPEPASVLLLATGSRGSGCAGGATVRLSGRRSPKLARVPDTNNFIEARHDRVPRSGLARASRRGRHFDPSRNPPDQRRPDRLGTKYMTVSKTPSV